MVANTGQVSLLDKGFAFFGAFVNSGVATLDWDELFLGVSICAISVAT
jgi:hypothetical protein